MLNVALNLVLIPYFKESAAAFTTLLAELCSMVMCIHYSKGLVELVFDWKIVGSVAVGCFGILAVCTVVKALPLPLLATIFTAVLGSVAVYGVILIALKTRWCWSIWPNSSRRSNAGSELFHATASFWPLSVKITTFRTGNRQSLLINYLSSLLANITLFVYNKDVRGGKPR